jgi:hypothetical protein
MSLFFHTGLTKTFASFSVDKPALLSAVDRQVLSFAGEIWCYGLRCSTFVVRSSFYPKYLALFETPEYGLPCPEPPKIFCLCSGRLPGWRHQRTIWNSYHGLKPNGADH